LYRSEAGIHVSITGSQNSAVVLEVVAEWQVKQCRRRRSEIVEKLVLEAIEDTNQEVFILDRLSCPVVQGDYHRRLIGWCPGCGGAGVSFRFGFRHEHLLLSVALRGRQKRLKSVRRKQRRSKDYLI